MENLKPSTWTDRVRGLFDSCTCVFCFCMHDDQILVKYQNKSKLNNKKLKQVAMYARN